MLRKLTRLDYTLILIGLISFAFGVRTMLETPTSILSNWYLVAIYTCFLLTLSFGLGSFISLLTKAKIHLLASASLIVTIVCLVFYISEFKPIYKIYVADNFVGEVKLFHSKLNSNQLSLNKFGVGYVNNKTYRQGFRPIVYQNGKDITKKCKIMVQGSVAAASVDGINVGPFSYLGFTVGDNSGDTIWNNLIKVIEMKVIDTTIMNK